MNKASTSIIDKADMQGTKLSSETMNKASTSSSISVNKSIEMASSSSSSYRPRHSLLQEENQD
jgi:hypothetical protein